MVTRGESCALPIPAQPLAGIELPPADEAARKQPAKRRFGDVHGYRTASPDGSLRPERQDFASDSAFTQKARSITLFHPDLLPSESQFACHMGKPVGQSENRFGYIALGRRSR
jgi:hypothetical protein